MRRIALAAVLLAALALPAAADEWPSRPVRIVNTFAAGGAADILARTVADHLTQTFGQQFFVETRAGAGGAIGVQTVINTPPDGYNFVITTVSLLVLLPISNPKLGFDPRRDLTNIVLIAGSPVVFSVNPASGIKSRIATSSPSATAYGTPMTSSTTVAEAPAMTLITMFPVT